MSHPNAVVRNSLLTNLAPADFALLQPQLRRVSLAKGEVMIEPNTPIDDVHFPESALLSVVAISPDGHKAEATVVGGEGMLSIAVILGADRTPHQVIAQIEGDAWRMSSDAFRAALAQSPSLRESMLRYVHTVYVQTTYTALSNANHGVEERLARWLLMSHDRTEGDDLALTHEFLSIMLAVRRPSVTTALHVLEGLHFIRAQRGRVLIRDRAALEEFAHDAYGTAEAEYERLVGPMPKSRELAAIARSRQSNQHHIDGLNSSLADGPPLA